VLSTRKEETFNYVQPNPKARRWTGLGQLTLVEHALCPLDARTSLVENLVHESLYHFMDHNRQWRQARARVHCPLGLSANDEFYLWGLLALTFQQQGGDRELHATPHYCLRQLGCIDTHWRRGGKHYRLFAQAVERLAFVRYQNDRFYDPVRGEHRKVSFGFFSYSLPIDPESSRAWRIAWDPIFFDFVKATSGHLRFDLEIYRQMDPASRRMFLMLAKIFHRRSITPVFELRQLALDVLGFSPSLNSSDLKRKVAHCVSRLCKLEIVGGEAEINFQKRRKGEYVFTLTRGRYFEKRPTATPLIVAADSPLYEPLRKIGFDDAGIASLLRRHRLPLLREWTDITLAAREKNGTGFFKKSPLAYLLDSLKHASQGARTPPDWWRDMRKAEVEYTAKASGNLRAPSAAIEPANAVLNRMLDEGPLASLGPLSNLAVPNRQTE